MGILEKIFKTSKNKGLEKLEAPDKKHEVPEMPDRSDAPDSGADSEPGDKEAAPEMAEYPEARNFNISTVYDFIQALKWSYDEAEENEDNDTRRLLGHQIVKIHAGLNAAGLSANEVMVKEMENGTLGTYNRGGHKISAAKAMLEDFKTDERLFRTVFVHEKTHKEEGIADEGFTQLRTERKTSATPGIYENEKAQAKRIFYKEGIDHALVLYDIDRPEKLVDDYLEVELLGKINKTQLKELTVDKKKLDRVVKEQSGKLAGLLKDGVPRLYDKLKSGYIKDKTRKILEERIGKWKV